MKTRNGFVSNSSSSSFMILESKLTNEQLELIYSHADHLISKEDAWEISIVVEYGARFVRGRTWMDNFDMREYLKEVVKVNRRDIKWED